MDTFPPGNVQKGIGIIELTCSKKGKENLATEKNLAFNVPLEKKILNKTLPNPRAGI